MRKPIPTPPQINHPVQPLEWKFLAGRRRLEPTPYPKQKVYLWGFKIAYRNIK